MITNVSPRGHFVFFRVARMNLYLSQAFETLSFDLTSDILTDVRKILVANIEHVPLWVEFRDLFSPGINTSTRGQTPAITKIEPFQTFELTIWISALADPEAWEVSQLGALFRTDLRGFLYTWIEDPWPNRWDDPDLKTEFKVDLLLPARLPVVHWIDYELIFVPLIPPAAPNINNE
jgi:hypothetical protein